jgi:hypothetical protein
MKRIIVAGILVACFLLAAGCSTRQVPPLTPAPTVTTTATGYANNLSRLPSYAFASADITEAYLFATEHPDALNGVECHCGCMETPHGGRIHTRGLIDCYFREDGTYDTHASNCARCIADTLDVKTLFLKGMSKDAINQTLEAKYESGTVSAPTMAENCSVLVTVAAGPESPSGTGTSTCTS